MAIVRVPRGVDVHSQWHNNRNTYYIRVGTQSREPTPQELSRLFQQRGTFRAELRPISGATINDLDRRRLKDYFGRVRQQDVPGDDDNAGWQTLLVNTEIMVEEGVTLSGLLLFGKAPNRYLPQAGIDAAALPGIEKDYAAKERTALRGPMTPLMDGDGTVLEAGLVEQALEFVRRNTPVTAVLEEGGRRVERPTYPVAVIRKAVVNALIHRDYLLANTDIELAIYEDRLEITSPGKLPNGFTPERMRAGTRAARNQLLKDVMRDYADLEHMGMGIPKIIIRGMRGHNDTEPDLIEEGERFIVRLFIKAQQNRRKVDLTRKPVIAWIIRFEWFGDHAAVDNPIVDIVSGRKGEAYVCDHIQRLHDLLLHSFGERADFARGGQSASNRYLAKVERTRNGSVIVVGNNPCLTARKVKNFAVSIDKKTDKEIIVADGLESSHVMDFCDMIGVGTGN